MSAKSRDAAFAELLWSRPADLDSMVPRVVLGGRTLGPITLGESGTKVHDRLSRLPKGPNGYRLQLEPDHPAEAGTASATDAYHLTATAVTPATLPNEPQCWLEWSSDPEQDRVVHVRFCVIFEPNQDDIHEQLVTGFRAAFDAQYGPGLERKKKPKRNAVRPIDWSLDGDILTLGCFDHGGRRFVVCEMAESAWADEPCLRMEVFR